MQTWWYKWLRKGTRSKWCHHHCHWLKLLLLTSSFLAECLHQFPVMMFLQFELSSLWPSHLFLQSISNR